MKSGNKKTVKREGKDRDFEIQSKISNRGDNEPLNNIFSILEKCWIRRKINERSKRFK